MSEHFVKLAAHLPISYFCEQSALERMRESEMRVRGWVTLLSVSWFHLKTTGSEVIAWPHQISPNWGRCLEKVKGSNLKDIKCKCDRHVHTSNTAGPTLKDSEWKLVACLAKSNLEQKKWLQLYLTMQCLLLQLQTLINTQRLHCNCYYIILPGMYCTLPT